MLYRALHCNACALIAIKILIPVTCDGDFFMLTPHTPLYKIILANLFPMGKPDI